MPTARKQTTTSRSFSPKQIAAARAAAKVAASPTDDADAIDWRHGSVSHGGGVAATIETLCRTRGKNKNATKEQVAIRFDADVLAAFRAKGAGWQTRMNAALKDWIQSHPARGKR